MSFVGSSGLSRECIGFGQSPSDELYHSPMLSWTFRKLQELKSFVFVRVGWPTVGVIIALANGR